MSEELYNEIDEIDEIDELSVDENLVEETKEESELSDDGNIHEEERKEIKSEEVIDAQKRQETEAIEKSAETKEADFEKVEKGEVFENKIPEEKDLKEESKKANPQVDVLLAEVERLSKIVSEKPSITDKRKEEIFDFIKDVDMDDLSSDPKVLNKILNTVAENVEVQTTERVLRSIPQIIMSQIQQHNYSKKIADDFYTEHPDLSNVRQVVKVCAEQIRTDNPDWDTKKILSEAAVRSRKTLGISSSVNSINIDNNKSNMSFTKDGSVRKKDEDQRSAFQKELDEL